jgi:hypothetical protein
MRAMEPPTPVVLLLHLVRPVSGETHRTAGTRWCRASGDRPPGNPRMSLGASIYHDHKQR